jgi:hypothetical protein
MQTSQARGVCSLVVCCGMYRDHHHHRHTPGAAVAAAAARAAAVGYRSGKALPAR